MLAAVALTEEIRVLMAIVPVLVVVVELVDLEIVLKAVNLDASSLEVAVVVTP